MTALLATLTVALSPAPARPCDRYFTPLDGNRAALAIYHGTRRVTLHDLKRLGYIERCQQDPRDQARVRARDRRMDREHKARLHPAPAPAAAGWSPPWDCIARYESGGNPAANTGNGYYGGLQFSLETWTAYGGQGNPAGASIPEQEAVARRVLAAQGWGAWPNTSRLCGL
jgi:hypothetical protein